MWRYGSKERLGEFYDDKIFDGTKAQIAYMDRRSVFRVGGALLGEVKEGAITFDSNVTMGSISLFMEGIVVGQCFPGDYNVALVGLALLGRELALIS